jgi:ABC-type transport system involved in cytochrome bd biosynthesis fused ATPase/permease subunit
MNWLKKIMAGRYGSDQLSMALVSISILLVLIFGFTKVNIILYLSYVPLLICVFRIFSKDINKRRMENYKFAMLMSPIYSWTRKKASKLQSLKTYKYFKCPNCKRKLRVPRHKGKISITCPVCKSEFIRKS